MKFATCIEAIGGSSMRWQARLLCLIAMLVPAAAAAQNRDPYPPLQSPNIQYPSQSTDTPNAVPDQSAAPDVDEPAQADTTGLEIPASPGR